MFNGLLMTLLFLSSVFLILLVLVQRGRGGGLAGAFGGMGGQSAFGTKAGDLFTRITIFVAAFWIILCAVSVKRFSGATDSLLDSGLGRSAKTTTNSSATAPPSNAPAKSGAAEAGKAAPATEPAATAPAATAPAPAAPAAATPAPAGDTPASTPEKAK